MNMRRKSAETADHEGPAARQAAVDEVAALIAEKRGSVLATGGGRITKERVTVGV